MARGNIMLSYGWPSGETGDCRYILTSLKIDLEAFV
jgi:hypothetical protein